MDRPQCQTEVMVTRLMDRAYMTRQRSFVSESHDVITLKRIEKRELWELEREKKLILEGKMGVDDAPYIADHPVFKVSKMINSILDEKKEKVEEKFKPKITKSLDYNKLREETGYETEDDPDSFQELDQEELDRARKLWEIEQQIEEGQIFTQEEYDRIKYEEPLIKQLRSVETVAEMYELADEIVGPICRSVKNKKRYG